MAHEDVEVLDLLDLVLGRGPGLVVLVSDSITAGHGITGSLAGHWGVRPVSWEQAFDQLDDKPRVAWDLPFLDEALRHEALVRLNRSRDRLAGLSATTLLWVLEADLAMCWQVAQDLMDWAVEIIEWPTLPNERPGLPEIIRLPPSVGVTTPSLSTLPYRWSAFTALSGRGARVWLEFGEIQLVQAAMGLATFLVEQGEQVMVCELGRADVVRIGRWLLEFDWQGIVLLAGALPAVMDLPARSRVAVLAERRARLPAPWRRLGVSVEWLESPRQDLLFSPISSLFHDRLGIGDVLASRLGASSGSEKDER